MSRKVNPYRKPITQADIANAKQEAVQFSWGAFMLACGDVGGLAQQEMNAVWDRVNEHEQEFVAGKLTLEFLHETLLNRHGIYVEANYGGAIRKRAHRGAITQGDLNRAKMQAIRFSFCVFMVALGEVGKLDNGQMQRVWRKITEDYEPDYMAGKLTIKMLHDTLLEDYSIRLVDG